MVSASINSVPQPAATTFVFSSVFILLLCCTRTLTRIHCSIFYMSQFFRLGLEDNNKDWLHSLAFFPFKSSRNHFNFECTPWPRWPCSIWQPSVPAVCGAAGQEGGRLPPQLLQEGEEWWGQPPHPLTPHTRGCQGIYNIYSCFSTTVYFTLSNILTYWWGEGGL